MNKKKRIAIAVVSTVMAGVMLVPLAACGGGPNDNGGESYIPSRGRRSTEILTTSYNGTGVIENGVMVKEAGSKTLVYPVGTTLNMNVCDGDKKDRTIAFDSGDAQISGTAVLPDNYSYRGGDLKPAWWQMGQNLGVQFVNKAQLKPSDKQIEDLFIQGGKPEDYQIVTGSGAKIVEKAGNFVNLTDYLDYMPNYKAFLEANEIVKWSLSSGMDAKTGKVTGAMYYAPYFDGNNDIEKYVLTHREWTRAILDSADVSAATTTWAQSKTGKSDVGANQTYVEAFMGQTGSYQVDVTNPANEKQLVKITVNYEAAKTAANTEGEALNTAIKAAYSGFNSVESGNIVDIQNAVISGTDGAVTGAQLINILRAYIDVAYQNAAGEKFYATRSDVFNSVSAAWDVDLYVAISRCVVTSYKLFGGKVATNAEASQIYALAGRQGTTQRRTDLVCFVGELYGVRGLESRSEYLYIDANGDLQDARQNAATYDALDRLSALSKEGLVYTGTEDVTAKYYKNSSSILTYSMHDYAQTQTTDGFYAQGIEALAAKNPGVIAEGDLKFDVAPILTPVSNWDTDNDGTADKIMRFTESWRAVKNTGFAVPTAAVTNPATFSATLAFIDYLFSNDGQIVATYGPRSTNGNVVTTSTTDKDDAPNGFWYGTEVTNVEIDTVAEKYEGSSQYHVKKEYEGQYFIFENKVYTSETTFGTKKIPTLTTHNYNYYLGLSVNGHYLGDGATVQQGGKGVGYKTKHGMKYTDYDRGIIGGALPIGNKDQGFEFQGTASCALDGTNIVSKAKDNGAIRHLVQEVNDKTNAPEYAKSTYWYTCIPTTLPLNSADGTTLSNQKKLMGSGTAAGLFLNTSTKNAPATNMFIDLLLYGYNSGKPLASDANSFGKVPANAAGCIAAANEQGLAERISIYAKGWNALKEYFVK
ncbi:MAG: hypothetical protein K2I20_00405 [Clostridia bacterium]|nr:hypothetical protein [Clostridia bacterium]